MTKKAEIPVWKKITLTIDEAAAYSNIGINKLQELVREPDCNFIIYVGSKRLIKRIKFEKFIEGEYSI